MLSNIVKTVRSLRQALSSPVNLIAALLFALLLLLFTIWLSVHDLIKWVLTTSYIDHTDKVKIIWSSLGVFRTNFTLTSQIISIVVAILAGLNVVLLIHYLRKRVNLQRESGISIAGIILGMLGVGCSACGSIVLSSLFGLTAASTFLSFLPLNGVEFGLLSMLAILLSIYFMGKKINNHDKCRITTNQNK